MILKAQKLRDLAVLAVVGGYAYYLFFSLFKTAHGISSGIKIVIFYSISGFTVLSLLLAARVTLKLKFTSGSLPRASELLGRLTHVLMFLTVIFVLKNTDLAWRDFDRTGSVMAGYQLSRLIFILYFMLACYGAGRLLIEKYFNPGAGIGGADQFILYFFSGASLLAVISVIAGFLGFLNILFALFLVVPLIFYTAPVACRPAQLLYECAGKVYRKDLAQFSSFFIFSWILAGVALLFLILNGFYPGVVEGDVWTHYLPYFREVIRTGHLGPNEIWYHYYLSKGAGLFFLSGVLSDVFSIQLVSVFFIFASCVILFQLCRGFSKNSLLALTAVIVFLALYQGSFFKHHVLMTGYIVFMIWMITRLLIEDGAFKVYFLCSAFSFFYIGFYQPIVLGILILSFMCITTWYYLLKAPRIKVAALLLISLAGIAGICAALAVNFFVTGLGYDVPIQFFWCFADVSKFLRTVGPSGIAYFMQIRSGFSLVNSMGLQPNAGYFNPQWAGSMLRADAISKLFPAILFPIGLFIGFKKIKELVLDKTLIVCALFILCAGLFGQVIQIDTILRLYIFMYFFMVLVSFLILDLLLGALPDFFKKTVSALFLFILVFSSFSSMIDRISPTHLNAVFDYARGKLSFASALRETERVVGTSVTIGGAGKFLDRIGRSERIFHLGYDPGPADSFPGRGMAGEPSFTLGPKAEEIMFGPPEAAKRYLKEQGFNYFMTTLEEPFLMGLPFSPLFNAENLERYFRVVAREGSAYLLSWREGGAAGDRVPSLLIQVNELKRTTVSSYPFSEEFEHDLAPVVRAYIRRGKLLEADGEGVSLDERIMKFLMLNMLAPLEIEENQVLMGQAIVFLGSHLRASRMQLVNGVNQMKQERSAGNERAAVRGISWYIRSTIRNFYFKRYGPAMAQLLMSFKGAVKDIYGSRDNFRRLLNLR